MNRKVRFLPLILIIVGLLIAVVPRSALATSKVVASNRGTTFWPGWALGAGDYLLSTSGEFQMIMQGDRNLVLYRSGHGALWASNTWGHPGAWAVMQYDGNLVVYIGSNNYNKMALWASNTSGYNGAHADMQQDGNFVIYTGSGQAPWATNTGFGVWSCPSNGTPPCRSYWDTVTIKTGTGYNVGCIDLSAGTWGAYTTYDFIYGWSYIDAYGRKFERTYLAGDGDGVGPLIEVGSYTYYSCD